MTDIDALKKLAEEALARAEAAIEGPWAVEDDDFDYAVFVDDHGFGTAYVAERCNQGENGETAHFIASARSDVPQLARAVIELIKENGRLRQTLEPIFEGHKPDLQAIARALRAEDE